jgi:hypothetical protein
MAALAAERGRQAPDDSERRLYLGKQSGGSAPCE